MLSLLGLGDLGSDMVYRFDKKDMWGLTVYFEDTIKIRFRILIDIRYEPKVARLDQFYQMRIQTPLA